MAKRIKVRKEKFGVPRSVRAHYPNVKYVVDADEAVNVKVCAPDVKHSKSMDPTGCAMALAVKREMKADAAIIGISTSYIIKGDRAVRFQTPDSVQREIVSFDRNHNFEPGEYYLTTKSHSNRLGEYVKSAGPKPTGRKVRVHLKQSKTQKIRVLPPGQV